MHSRAGQAQRDVVFFDGACGMCTRTSRWLRALDWLGRLEFRDATAQSAGGLPFDDAAFAKGIPMMTHKGVLLIGYTAMRRAIVQTPLGFVPGLLMYVPGISHIGRRIYAHVAANRVRRSVCESQNANDHRSSSSSS